MCPRTRVLVPALLHKTKALKFCSKKSTCPPKNILHSGALDALDIDVAERRAADSVHHVPDLDHRRKGRNVDHVVKSHVGGGNEIHERGRAPDILRMVSLAVVQKIIGKEDELTCLLGKSSICQIQ